MKTWYRVETTYTATEKTARIVKSIEADEKPRSSYRTERAANIITDWYGSREEAENHCIK